MANRIARFSDVEKAFDTFLFTLSFCLLFYLKFVTLGNFDLIRYENVIVAGFCAEFAVKLSHWPYSALHESEVSLWILVRIICDLLHGL